MRGWMTSVLELAGMSAVTVGSWVQFGTGVGLMVGGAFALVLGVVSA